MIAIDELKATAKRLELLRDNTDSIEERMMVNMLFGNLLDLAKQAEMISNSPAFKQEVEKEKQRLQSEKDIPRC